ncbi:MAG: AmmeMemoRadiSam system protein B [Deltaproteobacteria bacterium RIFOXYA12_FULL_61_11]|nr:MAG: AmmeMemoRadiSam system protein B [Deltaproteobacteria bacterium RIFOXYA12_FULL_61_11]
MPSRRAEFAGAWYPGKPSALRAAIEAFAVAPTVKSAAFGAVVPHAGYLYSGATAATTWAALPPVETVFLLGPSHTGEGSVIGIWPDGSWESPLGSTPVRSELCKELALRCPQAKLDLSNHHGEHALELQLPLLQHFLGFDCGIVPVCLNHASLEHCRSLGKALCELIQELDGKALIVASSDFSHGETQAETKRKDGLALEAILALDPEGLHAVVRRERISMCGVLPATAMLFAARGLGATTAEVLARTTSFAVSQREDWIVGYAGVVVR